MDSDHIRQALSIPLFRKHFVGFLFSDSLKLMKKKHRYLDFYVVNTNHVFGQHWFACIRGKKEWIIFDCSAFTPSKDHDVLREALCRESDVIFDCKQLQDPTSLSCGLHVISFIYYTFRNLEKRDTGSYIPNYYCNKLLKFCKFNHSSPDNFVYRSVYESGVFSIEVEDEREIDLWLKHFQ